MNKNTKDTLLSRYKIIYRTLTISKIFYLWIFFIFSIVFFLLTLYFVNKLFLVSVSAYGGKVTEGILNTPRYINPVLANKEEDKDLSRLIYSGLFKIDQNGELVNDLAEGLEKSENGLVYTVKLKTNNTFHDKKKLTVDDVIFTLNKIQDKELNSPLYIYFEGVTVEKIDDYTLVFNLKKPFIYFEENLTFGILPKHIWGEKDNSSFILDKTNLEPVGSGPYKINSVTYENNIPKSYKLEAFKKYSNHRPYINTYQINFFENQEKILAEINSNDINATAYLTEENLEKINIKDYKILSAKLPDLYSIYINTNRNKNLSDHNIRQSLELAINKDEIVNSVFKGFVTKANSILDTSFSNFYNEGSDSNTVDFLTNMTEAKTKLNSTLNPVKKIVTTKKDSRGRNITTTTYASSTTNNILSLIYSHHKQ